MEILVGLKEVKAEVKVKLASLLRMLSLILH